MVVGVVTAVVVVGVVIAVVVVVVVPVTVVVGVLHKPLLLQFRPFGQSVLV